MINAYKIALILFLLQNIVTVHVPHCVLKCKDAHMQQMENEWSMDFAFPLLSLLKTTRNETMAHKRAVEICRSNNLLADCLTRCNKSDERTIIELGLLPWKDICSNLHVLRTQFTCWRLNIINLTMNCLKENYELRESIKFLSANSSLLVVQKICLNLNKFAECSTRDYGRFCGYNSEKFIDRLFWISRDAIHDMLKIKWSSLPALCNINELKRELDPTSFFHASNKHSYCKPYQLLTNVIVLMYLS